MPDSALPTLLDAYGREIQLSEEKEEEQSYPDPLDEYWYQPIPGRFGESSKGKLSLAETIPAVVAGFDAIAKTFASLPGSIYRKKGERNVVDTSHPIHRIIHQKPNRLMDRVRFWKLEERSRLLYGNFYAVKGFDGNGILRELIPIHPSKVTTHITPEFEVVYEIHSSDGSEFLGREWLFHTIELSDNGIHGVSVIDAAASAFGLAKVHQEQSLALAENDSRPVGVLQSPSSPLRDQDQVNKLRDSWERIHRGPRRSGRVAVLPFGVEFKPISLSAKDAQALEMMRFSSIDQVCMMLDIPPYRLQNFERATFSNVEQADLFWGKNSLSPRVTAIEAAIDDQLLDNDPEVYSKFNIDAIYRADIKTRYEAHNTSIRGGWRTRYRVQQIEDENPDNDPRLKEYLLPRELATLDQIEAESKANTESSSSSKEEFGKRIKPVLEATLGRLITKEKKAIGRALKKQNFLKECEDFYSKHQKHMESELLSVAMSLGGSSGDVSEFVVNFLESRSDQMIAFAHYSSPEVCFSRIKSWDDEKTLSRLTRNFIEGINYETGNAS